MGETAIRRMTVAEFFEWESGDDRRYELVDGIPVLKDGDRNRHGDIAVSTRRAKILADRCRAIMAASAGVIPMRAGGPRLAIDVPWPTTRTLEMFARLEEYKAVESLNHIVLVDPDEPQAIHWWRAEDRTWQHQAHKGLQSVIALPDLDITISLGDLYRGLDFT